MKWAEYVARMGRSGKKLEILVEKPEGKTLLKRTRKYRVLQKQLYNLERVYRGHIQRNVAKHCKFDARGNVGFRLD
jgi:hypothetical protein